MKRSLIGGVALIAVAAIPVFAQSSQCPAGTVSALGVPDRSRATQDVCQQTIDLFQYMSPQFSTAIAGGNATLGSGGTLGGLGHFSIGLRASAVDGSVPQVQNTPAGLNGAKSQQFATKQIPVPMATADLGIGVFKGIPLGLTSIGGVDLLVSGTYVPNYNSDNVAVTPDTPLKLGYGVRVGALQESIFVPGIAVSYLKRDLPKTFLSAVNNADSLLVKDLDVQTTAWRVVASKSLILFSIAAGIGQDTYKTGASASGTVTRPVFGTYKSDAINIKAEDLTRTNMFFDASLNLAVFKIVGEIGQVSGGTITTYNTFADKAPDASRLYGSLGLRFGW